MVKICKLCEFPMVKRTSAKGDFYGCSKYPTCKHTEPITDGETPTPQARTTVASSQTVNTTIVKNMTEKPHSYEIGSSGNRHKIYYDEIAELIVHMKELKEAGFLDEEQIETVKM